MWIAWDAVPTLDRTFDDVMGSTFGTATNRQAFELLRSTCEVDPLLRTVEAGG